ncbi:MAG: DUF1003 domain-containing protein [Coriobacteriia bacterium]
MSRTWHERHRESRTVGQRVADATARLLGSWPFVILLNLMFSVQAAHAGPVLMMSQNRQAERDRFQAQSDFETNVKARVEIEQIRETLVRLEAQLTRMEERLGAG